MANEKLDQIIDRATIDHLKQRERAITEDLDFLSRLLTGDLDDADDDDDDDVRLFEDDVFEDDEEMEWDYDEERSFETTR